MRASLSLMLTNLRQSHHSPHGAPWVFPSSPCALIHTGEAESASSNVHLPAQVLRLPIYPAGTTVEYSTILPEVQAMMQERCMWTDTHPREIVDHKEDRDHSGDKQRFSQSSQVLSTALLMSMNLVPCRRSAPVSTETRILPRSPPRAFRRRRHRVSNSLDNTL
jgi:hypothetical protein